MSKERETSERPTSNEHPTSDCSRRPVGDVIQSGSRNEKKE